MFRTVITLAIAGAMSAPLAAQAQAQVNAQVQPQASAAAAQAEPAQPAQPQMVKKCRRVPDYPASGTMLGPTHMECRMVPAKGNGSANAPQGGETGSGGKK
jgi:hypothetical protein